MSSKNTKALSSRDLTRILTKEIGRVVDDVLEKNPDLGSEESIDELLKKALPEDDVKKMINAALIKTINAKAKDAVQVNFNQLINDVMSAEMISGVMKYKALTLGADELIKKVMTHGYRKAFDKITVLTELAYFVRLRTQDAEKNYQIIDELIKKLDAPEDWWGDRYGWTLKQWEDALAK